MKNIYTGFLTALVFSLILFLNLNFISAPHYINVTGGATTFYVLEDVAFTFNISINNSDFGSQNANITKVNMTLPASFSFNPPTNGTSAIGNFSNTSTVLIWQNTTPYLINATSQFVYFWFNATPATPGTYNLSVRTFNTTETVYSETNLTVVVNDTTRPSVTISNPSANGTNYSTSAFNFSLTLSDNVNISSCWFTLTSGINNYTMTVNESKTGANYTNASIADGTYTAKFYCNDTSNNLNGTEQTIFTIDTTAPAITLITPTNGNTAVQTSMNLNFNVSDNSVTNCSLILNGNIINFNSSVNRTGGTNVFANFSFTPIYNTWSVNCTDNANNKANSTTRSFSLSSFLFNGTVRDEAANALNNSVINITLRNQNTWGIVGYVSTTSNVSGRFNISLASNDSWLYSPVMTQRNSTYNQVDYVSKTIPPFPSLMMSFLAEANFYLTEAGTLNITAINQSGGTAVFQYEIKDTKLGYPIASDHSNYASEVLVYVPKNRNYSIMIFPNQSMPVSFNWNNFSSTSSYNLTDAPRSGNISRYNVTTKTLNKQFNISLTQIRIFGFANVSGINFTNFTVVPYLAEPGNMVHALYGDMPYNLSFSWQQTDIHNLSSDGYYNISLPGTTESSTVLLFAAAIGNDTRRYGGFRNITPSYGLAPQSINFTMYGLLGTNAAISMDSLSGGTFLVGTALQNFTIVNASNSSLGTIAAHGELTVNYTDYGAFEFTWMIDVAQSAAVSTFAVPMLNTTGFSEMNVYVNGGPSGGNGQYAPIKLTKKTVAQIQSNSNTTVRTFNPQALDGTTGSSISIALLFSNSTCDIPNPPAVCYIGGTNQNMSTFNPMGAIMGGGKISFRMGMGSVLVHYVNVDLMASGPPDALFEDNNDVSEGTSGSFSKAMRFGSGGPTIYDYILISMPYTQGSSTTTGLVETMDINLSLPTFYGENADGTMNWNNPIWSSSNGTNATNLAANYSHYATYLNDWQTLMNVNNCTKTEAQLNASRPCYVDLTNNKIWVRLPHFSGAGPNAGGNVITASSSSSSGGASGSSSNIEWTKMIVITDNQFKEGFTTELGVKHRARVRLNSIYHYVGVKKLTSTTASIEVSSTPQQKDFNIGDEKKFDVTDDGYYDISVKLNSITNNKASVTIKSISEKVGFVSEPVKEDKEVVETIKEAGEKIAEGIKETKEGKIATIAWWAIIIISAVLIAVIIFLLIKKRSGPKFRKRDFARFR